MNKELDYDSHYSDIAHRTNNKAQIRISYLHAMKENPVEGQVNLKMARFLSDEKRYKQAEFRYKKASMMMPSETAVFNEWGILLDKQGKLEGQEELFRRVIEIDSNSVNGICNLGTVLMNKCRFTEAMAMFEKSLEIKPNHIYSINNLASVYLVLGRYEKAIEKLNEVLELDNDHFTSYINLALVYNCLEKDAEAKENYKKIRAFLKRYPDRKEVMLWRFKRLLNLAGGNLLGEGTDEQKRNHNERFSKAIEEIMSLFEK